GGAPAARGACGRSVGPVPTGTATSSRRVVKAAGTPRIRLHDSRHSTLSLMEKAGVPISIVSAWAGHYDPSFTYSTYVRGDNTEALKRGSDTLAQNYKIAYLVKEITRRTAPENQQGPVSAS